MVLSPKIIISKHNLEGSTTRRCQAAYSASQLNRVEDIVSTSSES